MRRSLLIYIVIFVLIFVALIIFGRRVAKTPAHLVVDEIAGDVQLRRSGQSAWETLQIGAKIFVGDEVRCRERGLADLRGYDLSHIRLEEKTLIKVTTADVDNLQRRSLSTFEMASGKIWVKMTEELTKTAKFAVQTPYLRAVVRGTIFSIDIRQDGTTEIQTLEGVVGVKQGDFGSTIRDGEFAIYPPEPEFIKPEKMSQEQVQAWKEKREVVGAFLSVQKPAEGEKSDSDFIDTSGYTDPGNVVEVNGFRVKVDSNGKWTSRTLLQAGENTIIIVATDGEGRQQSISRTVHR